MFGRGQRSNLRVLRCRTRGDRHAVVGSADGSNLYEIRWEFGFWVWEFPEQFWVCRQPSNIDSYGFIEMSIFDSSLSLWLCYIRSEGSKRGRKNIIDRNQLTKHWFNSFLVWCTSSDHQPNLLRSEPNSSHFDAIISQNQLLLKDPNIKP